MQFELQIPFPRAGPEKTVKCPAVENLQFMLSVKDSDVGKAFIALYWKHRWLFPD